MAEKLKNSFRKKFKNFKWKKFQRSHNRSSREFCRSYRKIFGNVGKIEKIKKMLE